MDDCIRRDFAHFLVCHHVISKSPLSAHAVLFTETVPPNGQGSPSGSKNQTKAPMQDAANKSEPYRHASSYCVGSDGIECPLKGLKLASQPWLEIYSRLFL